MDSKNIKDYLHLYLGCDTDKGTVKINCIDGTATFDYIMGATAEYNRAQEEITRLKAENKEIGKMYANASAKLRDLQKEYSDTKANLHRAYNGLENYKQVKAELERERELRKEAIEVLFYLYSSGYLHGVNYNFKIKIEALIEKAKN